MHYHERHNSFVPDSAFLYICQLESFKHWCYTASLWVVVQNKSTLHNLQFLDITSCMGVSHNKCIRHLGSQYQWWIAWDLRITRVLLQVTLDKSFDGICFLRNVVNISSGILVDGTNRKVFGSFHNIYLVSMDEFRNVRVYVCWKLSAVGICWGGTPSASLFPSVINNISSCSFTVSISVQMVRESTQSSSKLAHLSSGHFGGGGH